MSQKRQIESEEPPDESSQEEVQEKKAKEEPTETETVCGQIVKLAKDLGSQKIGATHFLVVEIAYASDMDMKERIEVIAKTFADRMNGALYEMKFSTDSISMTWHFACTSWVSDALVFWTVSRLAESYVRQLTSSLIKQVATETQTALGLGPKEFTCLTTITKSTGVFTLGKAVSE